MVTDALRAAPSSTVGEAATRLSRAGEKAASVVAVVAEGEVVGLVTAERLLASDPASRLDDLMRPAPTPVDPSTPIESAAAATLHRDEPAIVVGRAGEPFLGVVPLAALGRVLLAEHEEDMARIGGYRAGTRSAIRAAEEPLEKRLWHRLPWLFVGLAGAMLSVLIVGSFEEQLDEVVLLAFFVPAVVYMADSVGTQTETLLIRALAADVRVGPVIRKELLTGVVLGLVVAAFFYPFAAIGWGNGDIALAVSLSLLCSCSIATAVAMLLPLTLSRLGFDPAFGSGPLATVIQDLLSIIIYFAIGVSIAT
jgi:magnesium transporter